VAIEILARLGCLGVHPRRLANPKATRPKVSHREIDRLVALAWKQGWWCERTRNNYIKCYPPNDQRMIVLASTPSGSRTPANNLAALKRSGLIA
jgi:hypothetical protein